MNLAVLLLHCKNEPRVTTLPRERIHPLTTNVAGHLLDQSGGRELLEFHVFDWFELPFSGGDGVLYAVMHTGALFWYRHDGRSDGSFRWSDNNGRKVGTGWNVKHVFSGGDGVIYAINDNNDLLWFRHDGRGDGSFRWTDNKSRRVSTG